MYTILIASVLGIGIALYINYKSMYPYSYALSALPGLIFGLGIGAMAALIISTDSEPKLVETFELQSVRDNSTVSGSFFLGSGRIDGGMVYTFYAKQGEGFRLKQLKSQHVLVRYDQDHPRVEKYIAWPRMSAFGWNCTYPEYIIYVPEGSITQGFELNAE